MNPITVNRHLEIRVSGSQGVRESGSQGAREPGCPGGSREDGTGSGVLGF